MPDRNQEDSKECQECRAHLYPHDPSKPTWVGHNNKRFPYAIDGYMAPDCYLCSNLDYEKEILGRGRDTPATKEDLATLEGLVAELQAENVHYRKLLLQTPASKDDQLRNQVKYLLKKISELENKPVTDKKHVRYK